MRAEHAFLRRSADDLAKTANVGVATVRRAEAEDGVPNLFVNKWRQSGVHLRMCGRIHQRRYTGSYLQEASTAEQMKE